MTINDLVQANAISYAKYGHTKTDFSQWKYLWDNLCTVFQSVKWESTDINPLETDQNVTRFANKNSATVWLHNNISIEDIVLVI